MKLQVQSWLEPLVNHLWNKRKDILKDYDENTEHLGDIFGFYFGYPDYAGLPRKVFSKLSDQHVNKIHHNVPEILKTSKTKKDFVKSLISLLSDGTVRVS